MVEYLWVFGHVGFSCFQRRRSVATNRDARRGPAQFNRGAADRAGGQHFRAAPDRPRAQVGDRGAERRHAGRHAARGLSPVVCTVSAMTPVTPAARTIAPTTSYFSFCSAEEEGGRASSLSFLSPVGTEADSCVRTIVRCVPDRRYSTVTPASWRIGSTTRRARPNAAASFGQL